MWGFWIFLAVLVLFFAWAGRRQGNRSRGPEARGDRFRRTRGFLP
jgi:hypothetical protein